MAKNVREDNMAADGSGKAHGIEYEGIVLRPSARTMGIFQSSSRQLDGRRVKIRARTMEVAVQPTTMTKTQLRTSLVKERTEGDTSKEWCMFKAVKATPCLTATSDGSMSFKRRANFFGQPWMTDDR